MLKKYRGTLVVTTLVMLLPVLAGLILWNRLPEQIPTHFGPSGDADSWSSKVFAVFGMPAIILALHWLCVLGSLKMDPRRENLEGRMMNLVLWICPVISVLMIVLIYGSALGADMKVEIIMPLLVGLMMVIVGNWLPKCKQTYTLGIKLPWTLADEDNWDRTHRFAGPVWAVCGLVMMAAAFVDSLRIWLFLAVLLVMLVVPTVYSYLLYRRKNEN